MSKYLIGIVFMMGMSGHSEIADFAFTNTNIYTANENQEYAQSLAVKDGKIIYVGSNEGVRSYIGDETEVRKLKGKQVLPGFVDQHNHIFEGASEAGGMCELPMGVSLSQMDKYLEECVGKFPEEEWLIGYGFSLDDILDDPKAGYYPIELLDEFFPDRPVIFMEYTSHAQWVNSKALELVGIDKNTPDLKGGAILKGEDGELMGILFDNAGDIVLEKAQMSLSNLNDLNYQGLLNGMAEVNAWGITTIGDGRMYWKRGWYDVWKKAEEQGVLTVRSSLRPWVYPDEPMDEQLMFFKKIIQNIPQSLLSINQVKMYTDGIIEMGTAKISKAYKETYLLQYPQGLNYIPPQEMKRWLAELNQIGLGAHIHAVGNLAISETLDAIEYVRKQGSEHNYGLTHLYLVDNKDINRFKVLNIDADFQFGGNYNEDQNYWIKEYVNIPANVTPIDKIYATGANVTLSSDWTVSPLNPLLGIANSLEIEQGSLSSLEAAIDAYTINGAKALGLSNITGSIEVGKSADFVILNQSIKKLKPKQLRKVKIIDTILQGDSVYPK